METYGYNFQLRAELQGGGTADDGGMFDAETPQEARNEFEQMARSGKYCRLCVYNWATGELVGEINSIQIIREPAYLWVTGPAGESYRVTVEKNS